MVKGRWKLLGVISVALISFIVVVVYLITGIIDSVNNEHIKTEYKSLKSSLMLQQSMIYDRLVESSYLLAENSTFKANLQLNDNNSLDYSAKDFALFMKVDLFVILDRDYKVKFDLHHKLSKTDTITDYNPIKKNLRGVDPETTFKKANLFSLNNTIYQVVAVPIFAGKDRTLGTLIMGVNFENFVLKPLQNTTPFNLYFYYNRKASTSRGASFKPYIDDLSSVSKRDTLKKVVVKKPAEALHHFRSNGIKKIAFATTLGAANKGLLLSIMQEREAFYKTDFWKNYYFLSLLSAVLVFIFIIGYAGLQKNRTNP